MTTIPKQNDLVTSNATIVYYADGKTQLGSFATQNRQPLTFDEMPEGRCPFPREQRDLIEGAYYLGLTQSELAERHKLWDSLIEVYEGARAKATAAPAQVAQQEVAGGAVAEAHRGVAQCPDRHPAVDVARRDHGVRQHGDRHRGHARGCP